MQPSRRSLCTLALAVVAVLLPPVPSDAVPPPRGGGPVPPAVRTALLRGVGRVERPRVDLQEVLAGGLARGDKSAGLRAAGRQAVPVLLGDFPDRSGTQQPLAFAATLFGPDDATFAAYFDRVSYGRLEVVGAVRGWYRAARPATSYEGTSNGLDIFAACHAGDFVRETVALADAAGFEWGAFDNDGPDGVANSGDDDGYVDLVMVVHAGRGGECGGNGYLWSHSYHLAGWGDGSYVTKVPRTGRPGEYLRVDDYTLQPELSCEAKPRLVEIGVFCHEYGHALGLPDLYDPDGLDGHGIGYWGLMGHGSWGGDGAHPARPVAPCAWSRAVVGWLEPRRVTEDGVQALAPVAEVPEAVLLQDPASRDTESFLVENRQRLGDDADLPGAGLLIWHVDEEVIAANLVTNRVNHGPIYGVALEQADGRENLHGSGILNRGDAGDPWPGASSAAVFDDSSLPASHANDGRKTAVVVGEFAVAAGIVSARMKIGVAAPTAVPSPPPPLDVDPCVPNPANPRTTIAYRLARDATLWAAVHDLRGRRVRQLAAEPRPAGPGVLTWDGADDHGAALPSGVYHVRIAAGTSRVTRKLVLVR
ncbi:MAG: M6 family metalloprotease domain-containing protein [Candidatus Krumholzibacteriia bacterium]